MAKTKPPLYPAVPSKELCHAFLAILRKKGWMTIEEFQTELASLGHPVSKTDIAWLIWAVYAIFDLTVKQYKTIKTQLS